MATASVDTEPMLKVRNVAIFIPGKTSFVKVAPKYCLALYKAKWRDKLTDPADPVRVIPPPVEYLDDPALLWRSVPEFDAAGVEERRLRSEFGNECFDLAYPGNSFAAAFEQVAAESQAATEVKSTPAIAELTQLPGVNATSARRLAEAGIDTIEKVAKADMPELARLVGRDRAAKVQEIAVSRLSK